MMQYYTMAITDGAFVFTPVTTGQSPKPMIYSQRDPQWANAKLGTSQSTIGGYGCLITSIASCLTDSGLAMTPLALNDWLKSNGGYSASNLFIFNSINKLNTLHFDSLLNCEGVPAPVIALDKAVYDGGYVVVKVDFDPKTIATEEHWVRYIGGSQMIDPWYGDIASITPRYRGKDAAQAILKAAIYKRAGAA